VRSCGPEFNYLFSLHRIKSLKSEILI
jgi:hypothetical protein